MLVCVYGTLRAGCSNHRLLEGSEFLGSVSVDGWAMYSMGGFPALVPAVGLAISGEVYRVTEAVMKTLDRLEGYPGWYDRTEVPTEFGDAWIYHFTDQAAVVGRRLIQSGDWKCA